jgi:hypothetical protein
LALFCFLVAILINKIGGAAAFCLATAASVAVAIFLVARQPVQLKLRPPRG